MARCLSLADNLPGKTVFFLDDPALWEKELNAGNYPRHAELSTTDATAMMAAFDEGKIGAFLFDGYTFPPSLTAEASRRGFCAEIQDFPGPNESHIALAPFMDERATCGERTILSGLSFALLDKRFGTARASGEDNPVSSWADNLLIAFGAFDSANVTSRILEALQTTHTRQTITVLLGEHAPHLEEVGRIVDSIEDARLSIGKKEIADLYLDCDMAIGAGGVSMLERMCLGVPSIIITTSDNQASQVRLAEKFGAIHYAGHLDTLDPETIRATVFGLANDAPCRKEMRKKGMDMVDGQGAVRAGERLAILRNEFERSECP